MSTSKIHFINTLNEYLKSLSIVLDEGTIEYFYKYFELSQKWGSVINITNNLELNKFVCENLIDPLLAYKSFVQNPSSRETVSLIDIGCGGGYVGIVWHILAHGKYNTTLLDSDRKKINFCKQVIRELGLSGIHAIQSRIEDYNSLKYDIIVSRATWDPATFFSNCYKNAQSNSWMLHFSSKKQQEKQLDKEVAQFAYQVPPAQVERYLSAIKLE